MLKAIIVTAILSLMPAPSPKWGETNEEYRARVDMIGERVDAAVQYAKPSARKALALAVVVIFHGESRFSPFVHSGERRGDGGHAICMGGNHQLSMSTEDWEGLAGATPEATERCARVTAERVVRAYWYCKGLDPKMGYPEAFTLYGTGRTCRSKETRWSGIFEGRGKRWEALFARKYPMTISLGGAG